MERIEKDWTELNFASVDFSSGNWCWGRGGYPLRNDEYAICYIHDDLSETRYKLPECLCQMLTLLEKSGADQERLKIRALLNGAI